LAITLISDHQYHLCTKHITIHYHFIQWTIEDRQIWLIYCPRNDMVAEIFMKALLFLKVKHFTSLLGLSMA
jgi:hypothetical protein